jgi:hypothetical protein
MKKLILLLLVSISLFGQFKFQKSLPDRYTIFLLNSAPYGATSFKDASQYSQTITTAGNVKSTTGTTTIKFGLNSTYFDGTGDYLALPAGSMWDFGTGDFTIDCWVYRTGTGAGTVFGVPNRASPYCLVFIFYGSLSEYVYVTSDGSSWLMTLNITATLNVWVHYAFVRSGPNFYLFKNGIAAGAPTTSSSAVFYSATDAPNIGRYNDGATGFTGYIQYLRVIKGKALWTANFDPPHHY